MNPTSRVLPGERARFVVLALLLFINSLVLESNEVVATSGFVSRVGTEEVLLVWAADMLIVILASGAYSLVVDRTRRERLAIGLFAGFGVLYVVLYALFLAAAPDWLSYPLLTVVNEQQWLLFPILIWALGNDVFSIAEAKRVFPLLGIAAFSGGVVGNALTAAVARWVAGATRGSIGLLLVNAGLLALMTFILVAAVGRIRVAARQSRQEEKVLDALREGLGFVREVPSYRYLTLAMVLLGVGFNVVEYQLIVSASQATSQTAGLEVVYASLRGGRTVLMLVVQGLAAGWLLKRMGFKSIFALMPTALLAGLLVALFWPTLIGAVIGEYLARVTLQGVDEPSRRAFLGLVPDERRGRVSAFVDGYLYPLGSLVSCGLIGATVLAVRHNLLSRQVGRSLYYGLGCVCTVAALWAITRFRAYYDKSMLNWRLRRRQRKSVLADLDL